MIAGLRRCSIQAAWLCRKLKEDEVVSPDAEICGDNKLSITLLL